MAGPLHSVIMPVRNGVRHIQAALESALDQLAREDEVIVVDNGSTDGTQAEVARLGDSRIRMTAEAKLGPAAARNHGLREARGTLISFLDHDDLWPAGRMAGLTAALAAMPRADAAYGRLRVRVDSGMDPGFAKLDGTYAPEIGLHVYLFRRTLLDRIAPMDETLLMSEDSDYLARLREAGMTCAVYDGDAAVYRRHDGNITLDVPAAGRGMLMLLARSIARKRQTGGGP
jgi:glycosyltransferase involved in cell wall biosynthesis